MNKPPKNAQMRFVFDVSFESFHYNPEHTYTLTVTEYADVCEGETLTSKSINCQNANEIIEKRQILFQNQSIASIQNQLREQFESLNAFISFCKQNEIDYDEEPLWCDEHSFNEYTGEHRGTYAPFAIPHNESESNEK